MFSLASVWRERSRAAALAACLVVAVPGASLAQDGDLAARVKSLEAEIANLKVMMSTLTSLVRATPPSALESGFQAPPQDDLEPRLGALEAKNGALANELAQVSGQIERLEAKLEAGMNAPPAPAPQDDLGGRVAALEAQNGALIIQLEKIGKQVNGLDAKLEAAPPTPEPTDDLQPRLGKLETKTGALADGLAKVDDQMKSLEAKLEAAPKVAPAVPLDDLKPRIGALETQIGALTKRLEEIGAQVTKLDAKLAVAPQAPAPSAPHAAAPEAETLPPRMSALTEEDEQAPAPDAAPQPEAASQNVDPRARWYGPKPGEEDDGNPKSIMPPDATTGALPDEIPQSFAALPDENAETLYKQGYGDYLRQDYAGAEKAFSRLVKAYPNDPLAGSAQYWVGETYYVRKHYRKAADAFLAGYRKYASDDKAPDSLLKLAMSLAALGDEDAACNTFDKLDATFPDAPGDIRSQAKCERKKAGC